MVILSFVIQLIVVVSLIYFVSGRLIGPNVSVVKRIVSVTISVFLTTFVFWYTYLRGSSLEEIRAMGVLNSSTLLWVGSMLLISMLLYLIFELFDPIGFDENGFRQKETSIFKKYKMYWRQQKRLRQVFSVAIRNGLTETVKYARTRENERQLAVALRQTLEQCGGIFVKFGQVLSTRKELLPQVFIEELERLQQHVPPMSEAQTEQVLRKALKKDVAEVFAHFQYTPIASASIGQVHLAALKETNEKVVVKLLRPEMKGVLLQDLSILVEFAEWISQKSTWAERIGFKDIAIGFAHALQEEIDFTIEARNMMQMKYLVTKSLQHVKVPTVHEAVSNDSILVMEYIDGYAISKATAYMTQQEINRFEFAETLLFSFLEQALVSGIFHADPHPGNIYIEKHSNDLTLLDFGAVGRLTTSEQEGMKLFLVGISQNKAEIVTDGIRLLVENADEVEESLLERKIDDVLLRISYVQNLQASELINSIFTVVSDCGLKFHPSVSVALRALVTLDGTLRIIEPSFNIFSEAKQFSQDYIKSTLKQPFKEPAKTRDRLEEELAMIIPNLSRIPRRIDQLFKKVEGGKIILHHDIFSDRHNANFIRQLFSRFILLMVGITFGIISVALLAISQFINTVYAVYLNTVSYLGLFLCAVLLVRLSIQAIREMKRSN
jgi:ubiquinone biosynthesis protein